MQCADFNGGYSVIRAACVVKWQGFYQLDFWKELSHLCRQSGVELDVIDDYSLQEYLAMPARYENIVCWCWQYKEPIGYGTGSNNFLFVDENFITRNDRLYCDCEGWNDRSRLATSGETSRPISSAELAELAEYIESNGIPWNHGGSRTGPILVFLRFDFRIIQYCEAHLPAAMPVLIRLHPRHKHIWPIQMKRLDPFLKRNPHWSVDQSDDTIAALRSARACVSDAGSAIHKAMAMGIPSASVGPGLFAGTGSALECDKNATRLQSLPDFVHSMDKVASFLHACYRNAQMHDIERSIDVSTFISRCNSGRPYPSAALGGPGR